MISIVLVRPLYAGNIGSVARAMKNMRLRDLRLVAPKADFKSLEARKMAAQARDLLNKAKVFENLALALQGFDLVIGTSRRRGGERSNWRTPREFAAEYTKMSVRHRVAILFGSEDRGLTNAEIAFCQRLINIPSDAKCPSLNLAQAVMVVAYECYNALLQSRSQKPEVKSSSAERFPNPAKLEAIEAMYQDLNQLLDEIGFLNRQNPTHLMRLVRNLLNRARPSDKEVRILRGICRQVRWWKTVL